MDVYSIMPTFLNVLYSKVYYIHGLAIFVLISYLYCCYKLSYWKKKGVPQLANTNRIFGDFKDAILFRKPPGYYLGEIYRRAPPDVPYVGFYIFHKPCLLLKDPEIIKKIFIRDSDNFPNRHFAGSTQMDSIGMVNLFGLKNSAWRYLRQKLTPTFTGSKLKQMLPLMIDTCKPMMDYLNNTLDGNHTEIIDIQEMNYKYAADLIANLSMGIKTDSFKNPDSEYNKSLKRFFSSFKRMVALVTVFFIPELVRIFGSLVLFDSSFFHKMFWEAVEARERSSGKRGDFIDTIIRLKNGDQNPIYKLEGDHLLFQSGMFFTGLESSSLATAFTLMELARNKECQNLARKDIKNAIDEYGWTNEAFNGMKYLDNCITETFRLHPPVSTLDRSGLEDYKIPDTDIIIEKETPVFISLYGLHSDPRFFDEADVFNPERFSCDKAIPGYIPFGAGPRKCIGSQLGQMHIKIVISMILLKYEIYQDTSVINKLDRRATFTTTAEGIKIKFSKLLQ